MFCGNCGKEISGESGVCEYCGAPCKGDGSIHEDKKTPLPLRFPGFGRKKKILAAVAAIVCVVGAVVILTVPRLLVSPKQKVLLGVAKTIKTGIDGDTTLAGILGLDEMMAKIRKGSTAQTLKMSYLEDGKGVEGIQIQAFSDQKKGLLRTVIAPTVGGMDLAEFMFYKKENLLYFGLPDVLGDLYYVDLANLRGEYSGSALDQLIQEKRYIKLGDTMPEDLTAKEADSYVKYCQEELNLLYDDMEVKKDGTEAVRVDGKSQKCDRYHVIISGSSVKDLMSASLDYLEDERGIYVFATERLMGVYGAIRQLRQNILPQFRFRDLDMTVCLDKKGRLVSVKGEWIITQGGGESAKLEYAGTFAGGISPLDKVRGTLLISVDSGECEFTFERDKEFQKRSSLRDQMELMVVETWEGSTYTYPYAYNFFYNLENGKWDFTLANTDSGYHIEGTGGISDVKKGQELSATVDEFNLFGACFEGSYELTSLEKEDIELPDGIEESISLFDMSKEELLEVGEDLADWADSYTNYK